MPEQPENYVKKSAIRRLVFFSLLLVSVILTINVGLVARAFSFPFTYLFGIGSYVIYIFIYVIAICGLIKGKSIKIKAKYIILGIIFFLATLALVSMVTAHIDGYKLVFSISKDENINFIDYLNSTIGKIGGEKG